MDVRPSRGGANGEGQSSEVMDDRMKELAWEKKEMEKKETTVTKHGATNGSADSEPVSIRQKKKKTKEPTREHLLIRENFLVARRWEMEMRAKHTQGQAAEIMGRVFDNHKKAEFPSEVPHNWTKELMEETKIGWQKCKEFYEMSSMKLRTSVPNKIWNNSSRRKRRSGLFKILDSESLQCRLVDGPLDRNIRH